MNRNYRSLARAKVLALISSWRKTYYSFFGMKIGQKVVLGKINCQWPHKVTLGNEATLEDGVLFKITKPFDEQNYIEVGERVFIGMRCEFNVNTQITIGNDCLIASNTTFVDTGHEIKKDLKINQQPCTRSGIVLQEDVWVGTNCIILQGVTIGKGSVIGAGSLVNKSIPEYQIWAGSPARFIRNRT